MPRHTIHEYLGVPKTWPVKENIKHEIVLMPNAKDIKTAKKKEPRACALHNAACRTFEIPNCAIGGRIAYIPQRDAKGKMYIARVQANAETQRAIKRFDRTGKMPTGGFTFIPLADGLTFKSKRTYMRKWQRGEVGHNSPARQVKRPNLRNVRAIPRSFAS